MSEKTRRTKIVATLGPPRRGKAGDVLFDPDMNPVAGEVAAGELLTWFIDAGVDVFRFNMSFAGDHTQPHKYGKNEREYLKWLMKNSKGAAKGVAVLGDLPGPKIRLGNLRIRKISDENGKTVEKIDNEGWIQRGDLICLNFESQSSAPGIARPSWFDDEVIAQADVLVNRQPFKDQIERVGNWRTIDLYLKNMEKERKPVVFPVGDGDVRFQPIKSKNGIVVCRVTQGGEIKEMRGLTIKGARLKAKAFQEQDRVALKFLLDNGGEMLAWVAVSFVQTGDDVLEVKKYIADYFSAKRGRAKRRTTLTEPGVIAKIETGEAWDNITDILDVVDGIMVARGDLGEQLDPEEVPIVQKELIRKCRVRGKPVITATEMLDSMQRNPEPKRSEATDVFNAVLDGTDAVMLSGETSSGKYPVQAIEMMAQLVTKAEGFFFTAGHRGAVEKILKESQSQSPENTERYRQRAGAAHAKAVVDKEYEWLADFYARKVGRSEMQSTTDRICAAVCQLSAEGNLPAILAPTNSGRTAFMISRFRPQAPILGVAHGERTYRKLILGYNIFPINIGTVRGDVFRLLEVAVKTAQAAGYLVPENNDSLEVVATAGLPLYHTGMTNLIRILRIKKS